MKLRNQKDRKLASEGYKALRNAIYAEKSEKTQSRKSGHLREAPARRRTGTAAGRATKQKSDQQRSNTSLNREKLVFKLGSTREMLLPAEVAKLLADVLEPLSKGEEVRVVSSSKEELTTQQAADLLHVSRPYLINILEKGELPFRKVGKHRRISLEDLSRYKDDIDSKRLNTLAELAKQAQELEMGYR